MKRFLVILMVLFFGFSATAGATTFQLGGDRLVDTQNNDGGWDWPLADADPTDASPKNTAAPIAMGLVSAYKETGNTTYLDQAVAAGEFIKTNSPPHSTGNGIFMKTLSDITGDSSYADDVKTEFYDALAVGTYYHSKTDTNYGTAGYAQYILDLRADQSIKNLGIWDIGLAAAGAAMNGAAQSELDIWGDKIEVGLNNWEGDYSTGQSSYGVIGLAGGIFGLSTMGQDLDAAVTTANYLQGAQTTGELADILIGYQAASGGFGKYPDYPLDAYTGVQATAYAILALDAVDAALYAGQINAAASWLMDVQLASGGWGGSFAGASGENHEISGEALWAINTAPVPEPATMLLLGTGLTGLAAIRRRKRGSAA